MAAEYLNLGPDKVGFTFLGAIAVAVAADLEVEILFELRRLNVRRRLLWGLAIVAISVATGLGLCILLPALPEYGSAGLSRSGLNLFSVKSRDGLLHWIGRGRRVSGATLIRHAGMPAM